MCFWKGGNNITSPKFFNAMCKLQNPLSLSEGETLQSGTGQGFLGILTEQKFCWYVSYSSSFVPFPAGFISSMPFFFEAHPAFMQAMEAVDNALKGRELTLKAAMEEWAGEGIWLYNGSCNICLEACRTGL